MLAYLEANNCALKNNDWSEEQLIFAAFYNSPAMESGRVRLAELNKESRKRKTFAYASHDQFSEPFRVPPWVFNTGSDALSFAHGAPLESLYDYAEEAWKVRSRVRKYLLEYILTQEQVKVLEAGTKLPAGNESTLALSPDELHEQIRMREAKTAARNAKVKLAESIGVSVQQLDQIKISSIQLDPPRLEAAADTKKLQQFAIFNRLDVRKALLRFWTSELTVKEMQASQEVAVSPGPASSWNAEAGQIGLHLPTESLTNTTNPVFRDSMSKLQKAARLLLTLQSEITTNVSQACAEFAEASQNLKEGQARLGEVSDNLSERQKGSERNGNRDPDAIATLKLQKNLSYRAWLELLYKAHLAKFKLEEMLAAPLDKTGIW